MASGRGFRVGVPRPFFFEWVQPDVLAIVEEAVVVLRSCGVAIVDTPWPEAAAARACAFIINRVETAAVHERVATEEPERFRRYGAELRLRIAAGRDIPASLYVEALRARSLTRDSVATLFATHQLDALLGPTLPTVAVAADGPVITGTGRDESIGAGWTRLTIRCSRCPPVSAAMVCRSASSSPVGRAARPCCFSWAGCSKARSADSRRPCSPRQATPVNGRRNDLER
jgi:aspartyl-tRNA(Asn)/glutamyl-tRNA(Gln) amidotransferase subunit A